MARLSHFMTDTSNIAFHWSSGKDSALALHYLMQDLAFEIRYLVTTVNEHHQRVTMHGTPLTLLRKQFEAIGIPYRLVQLPESPSMEVYENEIRFCMYSLKQQGVTHAAFGDIFLNDLKVYREETMKTYGLASVFPLWRRNTRNLLHEFIELGFKAVVVCANEQMGRDFVGRRIDASFIADLPNDIDPCGENGEFHTFCYDGPIFEHPIAFDMGEKVQKPYPNPAGNGVVNFWFMDLISTP